MSQCWQKYSPEFRRAALAQMQNCPNVAGLARELGIRRQLLYEWKEEAARSAGESQPEAPGRPDPAPERAASAQTLARVRQLEALVARQSLELDFFKGALQRVEERRRKRETTSVPPSTSKSGK